jgi:hypothetical protein
MDADLQREEEYNLKYLVTWAIDPGAGIREALEKLPIFFRRVI